MTMSCSMWIYSRLTFRTSTVCGTRRAFTSWLYTNNNNNNEQTNQPTNTPDHNTCRRQASGCCHTRALGERQTAGIRRHRHQCRLPPRRHGDHDRGAAADKAASNKEAKYRQHGQQPRLCTVSVATAHRVSRDLN